MIDPKLNELPIEQTANPAETVKNRPGEREALERVSSSLSVNDTVAANAALSVGGRGVETSGTSAGAGAGAGMTKPHATASAITAIVPDGRGSGTTELGSQNAAAASTVSGSAVSGVSTYTDREVSERAYHLWCERGCPSGSPEVDWAAAEQELQSRKTQAAGA